MIFNLLVFLAVLSVLVFVHELGHFLAAKWCGVYVKRFSIGMPPRLFGVQVGETDYCVGALPFGGFVMMAGQEDVPLTEEERQKEYGDIPDHRKFDRRPARERLLILFMGPLMNLVLAFVLYFGIALAGETVPEWDASPRVGEVEADSPAASAALYRIDEGTTALDFHAPPDTVGWEPGDLIATVNGKSIRNISELAAIAVLHGTGTYHDIIIERETEPGKPPIRYACRVAPRVMGEGRSARPRFGVSPFETPRIGEVTRAEAPAAVAGLRAGDVIWRVNGKRVTRAQFVRTIEDTPDGEPVQLEVLREGNLISMTVFPRSTGRIRGMSLAPRPDGTAEVQSLTASMAAFSGLLPGDIIVSLEGKPVTEASLRQLEESRPGAVLAAEATRPARLLGLAARSGRLRVNIPVDTVRAIGVALDPVTVHRSFGLLGSFPEALRNGWRDVTQTLLTLKGLVTRDVSPRDLGGPLMIYDVTAQAARVGFSWLVRITALISVNLFIFNLLPLPVLDGGQIVTNLVEGLRGRPLNTVVLERVQQVGIILVLLLMIYVTFNDIMRKMAEPLLR
ncbi:MAG TPA: site-2 protease family protein [Candidatus Hydrogenedentes bacterium]|nr:site-2 protease family protein [Candidatus Hydrogenedentota bacterium]